VKNKIFDLPVFLFIRLSSPFPSVFHRNIFAKPEATGTSVTGLQTASQGVVCQFNRTFVWVSVFPPSQLESSFSYFVQTVDICL